MDGPVGSKFRTLILRLISMFSGGLTIYGDLVDQVQQQTMFFGMLIHYTAIVSRKFSRTRLTLTSRDSNIPGLQERDSQVLIFHLTRNRTLLISRKMELNICTLFISKTGFILVNGFVKTGRFPIRLLTQRNY